MITNTLIDSGNLTNPKTVFTASTTTAITTMILCNVGNPDVEDETVDSSQVNVYLVPAGQSHQLQHLVVSRLIVPAGETVFFSDEKIILEDGDSIRIGASENDLIAVTVSALLYEVSQAKKYISL